MLSAEDALRAYASMINRLDISALECLLADDFQFASQWVITEIESKSAYLDYMFPKLEKVRHSGNAVWAEMGWLDRELPGPCVVLAQGGKDNLVALVLVRVENGRVKRLDLCSAPSPHSARRSGEYPGRTGS